MGALMISLDVNHPDVEEFIDCKTDLSRVNYANISVRVNDSFMKAVENDKDYILRWPCGADLDIDPEACAEYNKLYSNELSGNTLYWKKVKAREIFKKLVKNNWNYAEPGILYWDKITGYNLVANDPNFEYAGVNP